MGRKTFARLDGDKVRELFTIEENHERFAELTADAMDITGQDVRIGDEHDGTSFKEREPEMFHFMRAMAMVLKDNKSTLVIRPEAQAIFKRIKDSI